MQPLLPVLGQVTPVAAQMPRHQPQREIGRVFGAVGGGQGRGQAVHIVPRGQGQVPRAAAGGVGRQAAQRVQFGPQRGQRAHMAQHPQRRVPAGVLQHAEQLFGLALGRDARQQGRGRGQRGLGGRVQPKVQFHRQPHRAQHPQRVVLQRPGMGQPQHFVLQVLQPAQGVHQAVGVERVQSQGVDGEVAGPQVVFQGGAAIGREIQHLHRAARLRGQDDPGDVALCIEHEERGAQAVGHLAGEGHRAVGHHEIQVFDGPLEQPIAHRTAHQVQRPIRVPGAHQAGFVGQRLEIRRGGAHAGVAGG